MGTPEALARFPWALTPASAVVDLAGLVLAGKSACRLALESAASRAVLGWASETGVAAAVDTDHWVVLAGDRETAEAVMDMDRDSEPHAEELGRMLGYPACCTAIVAVLGESAIDSWAATAAMRDYAGPFRLINPSRYREGCALISHIPCRADCSASLHLARRLAYAIAPHVDQSWASPVAPMVAAAVFG